MLFERSLLSLPCAAITVACAVASGCAPYAALHCTEDGDCAPLGACVDGACRARGKPSVGEGEGERASVDPSEGEGEGGEGEGEGDRGARFENGFAARVALTIDGARVAGDEDLEGFAVLLDLTLPLLRAREDGGELELPEGSIDVAVLSGAGETLPLDIEGYDESTGHLLAWVRVPRLAPGEDTVLWLYAGREVPAPHASAEVWSDGYAAVLHFADSPSDASLEDASDQSVAIPRNLGSDDVVASRIGRGLRFADDNDAVELWCEDAVEGARQLTLEAWARMDGEHAANGFQRLFHMGYAEDRVLEMFVEDSSTLLFGAASFRVDYEDTQWWPLEYLDDFALGAWHHFVGVFDADAQTQQLYVDGELLFESFFYGEPPDDAEVIHVGNWDSRYTGADSRAWIGVLDEARVATRAHSAGWIATSYATSANPTTFIQPGAVERP